ncbi:MAG: hypothetical protein Q9160_009295 [Pyrenula sp. 1 TL-2023]
MDPGDNSGLEKELAQTRQAIDRLKAEIDKLKGEKQMDRDEIGALKGEAQSYQNELRSVNDKVQRLEEQALLETLARDIGKDVRLRYLEKHRQRMRDGRIGSPGRHRIKSGDRAAHRGKPVIDALLYLAGLMTDRTVYQNLYGVTPETIIRWKEVPGIVDVTGFRASLQSEGQLTEEWRALFERWLEIVKTHSSLADLKAASGKKDGTLQRLQGELERTYDILNEAILRGRQGAAPRNNL